MKILLMQNNVTDLTTLEAGKTIAQQWCSTIGLPLTFTDVDSSVQFRSVPFQNNVASGFVADNIQVFQEGIKLGQADVYLLVYDCTKTLPPTDPMLTHPSDSGIGMSIPISWYQSYATTFSIFLLHELCHYFFAKTGKTDITHLLNDGSLQAQYPDLYAKYNQLQPQDYYLYLLSQFVPQTPIVTITRGTDNGTEILGTLRTNDGQFGCYTLERPWKNNQTNISAIPKGTYTCLWKFMPSQLSFHYQLQGVPNRSGIYIHPLNFWWQSKGCIGLGSLPKDINSDGQIDIQNSRLIVKAFEKKMGGKSFTLVIQ